MARKLSRRELANYAAERLVAGDAVRPLMAQLAAYLVSSRRTGETAMLVRDIAAKLAEAGHVTGTLTSATQLSSQLRDELIAYTKQVTGAKHVALDEVVDQDVLGGVRLELPGRKLDATIAHRLTIFKTRYKKA